MNKDVGWTGEWVFYRWQRQRHYLNNWGSRIGSTAGGDSSLTAVTGEDQETAPWASPFDKNAHSHTAGSQHSCILCVHVFMYFESICTAQFSSSSPTVFTVRPGFKISRNVSKSKQNVSSYKIMSRLWDKVANTEPEKWCWVYPHLRPRSVRNASLSAASVIFRQNLKKIIGCLEESSKPSPHHFIKEWSLNHYKI